MPINSKRLKPLSYAELNDSQRSLWDSIVDGPRGRTVIDSEGHLRGPFEVLLRSPVVGQAISRVGESLRFGDCLPAALLELAILTTASHWKSDFEWDSHYPLAIAAGHTPEALAQVKAGRKPTSLGPEASCVYDVVREMVVTGRCSDELFAKAMTHLGEKRLADVAGVSGYYTLLAMQLGVFAVGPEIVKPA